MNRLFAFGCSLTDYSWPMWPWFLTDQFDIVYNYGRAGAGNEYIFNQFMHALKKHSIQSSDTVVISWSTYPRCDFYLDTGWHLMGNIFCNYDVNFINKIWSLKGAIDKTWVFIHAAIEILQTKNISFCFISVDDIFGPPNQAEISSIPWDITYEASLPEYFRGNARDFFCKEPWMTWVQSQPNWNAYRFEYDTRVRTDGHPSMLSMHEGVKQLIKPKLSLSHQAWIDDVVNDCDIMIKTMPLCQWTVFCNLLNKVRPSVPYFVTKEHLLEYRNVLLEFVHQNT
jgi:hypothetical protein